MTKTGPPSRKKSKTAQFIDSVSYHEAVGVRRADDCRCAGCPWHYDSSTMCDCDSNPTVGSLCYMHARFAGLRIGSSSIVGRGLFVQSKPFLGNKTTSVTDTKKQLVFPKGSIIGYYGGIYLSEEESKQAREYAGPYYDTYALSLTEYNVSHRVYPPRKAPKIQNGPVKPMGKIKRRDYNIDEDDSAVLRQTWDIDAREPTCSMTKYANDPRGTKYKANAYFDDAYLELDSVQFQRFLEGLPFYHGDAKISFSKASRERFLDTRTKYTPKSREDLRIVHRFAVFGCQIVASQDLYDGDEILIDYGDGYWYKIEVETDEDKDNSESEEEDNITAHGSDFSDTDDKPSHDEINYTTDGEKEGVNME